LGLIRQTKSSFEEKHLIVKTLACQLDANC